MSKWVTVENEKGHYYSLCLHQMSKSGHDPGKSGTVATLAKVRWTEKGEEELDEGGKWHLSIIRGKAASAESAQHHLLPVPQSCKEPARTGSPFINMRVNRTCHLPDEPHGPLGRAFCLYLPAYYLCIIPQK